MSLSVAAAVGSPVSSSAVPAPAEAEPRFQLVLNGSSAYTDGDYIVVLAKDPVARYDGGVQGIAPTRPEDGDKIDPQSAAVRKYRKVLTADQNRIAGVADARIQQRYSVALNGFAAEMTAEQATELARTKGVVSVERTELIKPADDTNSTDFLKLSGDTGVWSKLGGTKKAGEGTVIGVIDTGIWPESAAFAGQPLGDAPDPANRFRAYRDGESIVAEKKNSQVYTGVCQEGEEFTADLCNSKVVGARYFGEGYFNANGGTKNLADYEFVSPRDGGGHGTHTASTAAGNVDVEAKVDGQPLGRFSGVAPGASIASYKVLWSNKDPNLDGGVSSDIVAAIDQAVLDGVDVINYSVGSGRETAHNSAIQLAFLSAASAGVFVAASAGNSGPGASTMDNTSPWVTTVAASTVQQRSGTVVLGNGKKYVGNSTTVLSPVTARELVTAASVRAASAKEADAALCIAGTLDPEKAADKIVVCDRGVNARVDKSAEVKRAGGSAMVLVNLAANGLSGDLHSVPSVHLEAPQSLEVKEYAATAGATASLEPGNLTATETPYPQIAGFSSRGPSLSGKESLLKPDLAAPGVDILAAVAPASNHERDFDFMSGTSMAAPHVAGLGALLKGRNPSWTGMDVKSALMTTAYDLKNADGMASKDLFAQGAGHVDPTKMLDPGLVFTSGDEDWLGYLEGVGVDTGTGVPAIRPVDFNSPSIGAGEIFWKTTITRKVTAKKTGIYRATAAVPNFNVTVTPSILSIRTGETKTVKLTFDHKFGSRRDAYEMGHITWRGANTAVRIPVAAQTVSVRNEKPVVALRGATDSESWNMVPGSGGSWPTRKAGLVAGTSVAGKVKAGEVWEHEFSIPTGNKSVLWTTRTPKRAFGVNIDLTISRVVDGKRVVLASGKAQDAWESLGGLYAPAGTYVATVTGLADAPNTDGTEFAFAHYAAQRTSPVAAELTVTPTTVAATLGTPFQVTASVKDLDPAKTYLGFVEGGPEDNVKGSLVVANLG